MTGLLLIDKPEGLSSFDVVRRVRRVLRIKRVGHGGTLDPFATGLLPVAIGEATRLLEYLLGGWKRYQAVMRLGGVTDTLDVTGKIVGGSVPDDEVFRRLKQVFQSYLGEISQVPPMYSAIKRDGVPLYRLARQGSEVSRDARSVEIRSLEILSVDGLDVRFEVYCSKGTYVRSLADDIGRDLGCGAHLVQLRRVASGPFTLEASVSLAELEDWDWATPHSSLLSPLQTMTGYPFGQVSEPARKKLFHGVPPVLDEVTFSSRPVVGSLVSLVDDDRLLSVARFAPDREHESRGDFELCKVFPGA